MKCSDNAGYDRITSRFMKQGKVMISILLTHAINLSIMRKIFPKSLKIHKILPILKPEKNPHHKESYGPISNLPVVEKVFEEYVKEFVGKSFLSSVR